MPVTRKPRTADSEAATPSARKSPHRRPAQVTLEQARRIAVRAQLLDGSAKEILPTVRRLDFSNSIR